MDQEVYLMNEINYYVSAERPSYKRELIESLYTHQFIQLQASGLTPQQIVETLVARITNTNTPLLRPLAIKLEGSDFKALLTEGLTEKPWHEGEED